jgi:hypothetical protein
MLRAQWNSLRVGDKVHVHDVTDKAMRLLDGEVTVVQPKRDTNSLAVRVTLPGGGSTVLRPEWLAVHLDPHTTAERCWRCDEIAAANAG